MNKFDKKIAIIVKPAHIFFAGGVAIYIKTMIRSFPNIKIISI